MILDRLTLIKGKHVWRAKPQCANYHIPVTHRHTRRRIYLASSPYLTGSLITLNDLKGSSILPLGPFFACCCCFVVSVVVFRLALLVFLLLLLLCFALLFVFVCVGETFRVLVVFFFVVVSVGNFCYFYCLFVFDCLFWWSLFFWLSLSFLLLLFCCCCFLCFLLFCCGCWLLLLFVVVTAFGFGREGQLEFEGWVWLVRRVDLQPQRHLSCVFL